MSALIAVVGVGLAVSFVCSVLEAVLLSTTDGYVGVMQERGERAGPLLARMRSRIDEPIAAILTLNTIAHTAGAAVGGALALEVFGSRWIALFSVVLTLAILVLSEIVPKTLGATYWKRLAPATAYVLSFLMLVMKPILIPLAWLNRLIRPRGGEQPRVSRAELEILAEIGRREGALQEAEWQVMTNVMGLRETRVVEVMTPRTRIVGVPEDADVDHLMDVLLEAGHMRLPVYRGSLDDIVGVILARDVMRASRAGETGRAGELMRAVHFVPETKPVEQLIREMRSSRQNMAIVVDEFGGTAGLVTLEDLIEEIVGEIHDEHELVAPGIERVGDEWRISGLAPLHEVAEQLEVELADEEHDTIGGFIFGQLGRIAEPGDEVAVSGGRFLVVSMAGRRIERLSFRRNSRHARGWARS